MPLWNYLPLMFDCTNHNVMRMSLELVRMILHSMIKTCPFNSKTTRTDHRKFIHSWILLYHTPSYIWDEELQQPNAKQVCDNNFEFSVLDAERGWKHHPSQCFTCHSTELLLLPATHNQLCIWHESCCLNSKICAIFPPSGITHI